MRRVPRQVAVFALAAVLGGWTSGCRSPGAIAAGTLRIGVVAQAPPMVFRTKGRWTGVEAEFGRALAARLSLKPVFRPYPPERLEAALLDGQVDVLMAGLAITEERRVRMDFARPYLAVGQAALVRRADVHRCTTEIKIRGTQGRVGAVTNSAGADYALRYMPLAPLATFPEVAPAVAALRYNQIDLLVYDAPAAWWLALRHQDELALAPPVFARQEVAWAFRRGSAALREAANRALDDWQRDGTLETVLKRWLPVSN